MQASECATTRLQKLGLGWPRPWKHLAGIPSAAPTAHEPTATAYAEVTDTLRGLCPYCRQPAPAALAGDADTRYGLRPVSEFLDEAEHTDYLVPETTMQKESARCFDVVYPDCRHSSCFTKAYGRYVDGTGSVLHVARRLAESQAEPGSYTMQKFFGALRYFAPAEVARLLGFKLEVGERACSPCCLPRSNSHTVAGGDVKACQCAPYQLPLAKPRELWGLLGNSLNPQVVALVCEACDLSDLVQADTSKQDTTSLGHNTGV